LKGLLATKHGLNVTTEGAGLHVVQRDGWRCAKF